MGIESPARKDYAPYKVRAVWLASVISMFTHLHFCFPDFPWNFRHSKDGKERTKSRRMAWNEGKAKEGVGHFGCLPLKGDVE